eukprot:1799021-Pyramimonas_sp.AAC.1
MPWVRCFLRGGSSEPRNCGSALPRDCGSEGSCRGGDVGDAAGRGLFCASRAFDVAAGALSSGAVAEAAVSLEAASPSGPGEDEERGAPATAVGPAASNGLISICETAVPVEALATGG